MKISQKFLILLLASALVPVFIVSLVAYVYTVREFKNQVSERIEGIAAHQKQRIVIVNDHNIEILADISTKLALRSEIQSYVQTPTTGTKAAITDVLNDFLHSHSQLYRVSIAGPTGAVIASTDATLVGHQMGTDEVFTVGSLAATTSIFSKDPSGTIREYLAAPFHLENKFLGVAVLESGPSATRALIQDYTELGTTGETFLTRSYPDNHLKYLLPLRFDTAAALSNVDVAMAGVVHNAGSGVINTTDYRGHSVLMAVYPVERTDWQLVVKFDQAEVLAPVYRLRNVFLAIFVVVMLLTVLVSLWASETFTRPIRYLTGVVQRIQAGDLSQHVAVHSKDEIGILSSTFNAMTTSLLESRALIMASILGLSQGFILVDNDGVVQTMNGAARRLLGLSEEDAPRPAATLREALDGVKDLDLKARLDECIATGHSLELKNVAYRNAYFNIYITPVKTKQHVQGAVVLIADITDEKILQQYRDDYFSIASHELRTPLTAIHGNASMIIEDYMQDLKKPVLKKMVTDINDSSVRLIGLVNDFLDASRLEGGKFKYALEPVDLPAIARSVQKEYKAAGTLQGLYLRIEKPTGPVPPVYADANRVKQIMINLVGNALKFTKKGGITISFQPGHTTVEVHVADTGQGISEEGQRLLFHKFQQANENLLTRDGRGSGLGLYISRLLSEGMGGSIGIVRSEPGRGTTFAFRLPLATKAQQEQTSPVMSGEAPK